MLTSNDMNALIDWLAECSKDPVKFVLEGFEWGEGELEKYTGPDAWQLDILEKIRDGLLDINTAIRIAVASGHGIGKSALVAWIVLWAISTMEDTRGVVTANTDTQLRTKTWAELSKWYRLCVSKYIFNLTATAIYSMDTGHDKTWRIDIIPWSESNPEAFAGLHNKGQRILVIFDEASAIHDKIWEVTEGALTDEGTEIIFIAFGNPTRNTGKFSECFGKFRHRWYTKQVDSRTVSMTNKGLLKSWVDDYGEDSDFVRVRVKGEFPNSSVLQLIPLGLVESAMHRHITENQFSFAPKIIGVDVAWYGDDRSVIFLRQGLYSNILWSGRGVDNITLGGLIAQYEDKHNAEAVFIDKGAGAGVLSFGLTTGRMWIGVDFGGKALQERFINKRIEMWYLCKEWLEQGAILPVSDDLKTDLISPEYYYNPSGKLCLERKEDMKKRGLASPDYGDALALTFAQPVMSTKYRSKKARKCITEYDQFE